MPATPQPIRLAYDAKVDDVNTGERSVVAKITTDAVDRYREVIIPKGVDTKAYMKNPVVLWAHDLDCPPVGRVLWLKPTGDGKGLVAKTVFAPTEMGEELFALYSGEFLRAWSISGMPVDGSSGSPTPAEIRANPDYAAATWIYRKLSMTELSACSVGVNPEALTLAVSKGLHVCERIRKSLLADSRRETAPQPDLQTIPGSTVIDLPKLGVFRTFGDAHAALMKGLPRARRDEIKRAVADRIALMQGKV